MTQETECPTRLESDAPSSIDELTSGNRPGPHETVAKAILRSIRGDTGGKTIALEGTWGSGKSTVIEILRTLIAEEPDKLQLVLVDLWAHHGDPLRRTFLETVISQLARVGWLDKGVWDERLKKITERTKVTETTPAVHLGPLAKFAILLLLLLPFSIAIISIGLKDDVSPSLLPGYNLNFLTVVGGVLLLAPVFIAACKWNDDRFWTMIFHKLGVPSTSITVENPDPTSVEFERDFRDILDDALESPRQLIIVLDNLDRVEPQDALLVLSTLQTFLSFGEPGRIQAASRLWVVIPYDKKGLSRHWNRARPGDPNLDDQSADIAVSMLDKKFQLRFRVPPLILSDWGTFLLSHLIAALPVHTSEELHPVLDLYRAVAVKPGQVPTPRDIKLFVNQLASLHIQHQHQFPLPTLAYFALLTRSGQDIPEAIEERLPQQSTITSILGDSPNDELTSLWFNAPINIARQYRLSAPLAIALASADIDKFRELCQSSDAYWAVLDNLDFISFTFGQVTMAASTLVRSGVLADATPPETASLRRRILDQALATGTWYKDDIDCSQHVPQLITFLDNPSSIARIIRTASSAQSDAEDTTSPPEIIAKSMATSLAFLTNLPSATADQDPLTNTIKMPFNAADSWHAAAILAVQDPDCKHWARFRITPTPRKMVDSLKAIVDAGDYRAVGHKGALVIRECAPALTWDQPTSILEARISPGSPVPLEELTEILLTLDSLLSTDESASKAFDRLLSGGTLYHHALGQSNPDLLGLLVYLVLCHAPDLAPPPSAGNSIPGHERLLALLNDPKLHPGIVKTCSSRFKSTPDVASSLALAAKSPQARPFVDACITELATSPTAELLFSASLVSDNWEEILAALDHDAFDNLVERLVATGGVSEYIARGFNSSNLGLYASLMRGTKGTNSAYNEWCHTSLHSIDTGTWKSDLDEEGDLTDLVLDMLRFKVALRLGTPYQLALTAHVQGILDGGPLPATWAELWYMLPRAIGAEYGRNTFRRELLQAMIRARGAIPDGFFTLYSEDLPDSKAITSQPDAIYDLLSPILDSKNPEALECTVSQRC